MGNQQVRLNKANSVTDYVLDLPSGIYRITQDGKVFSQSKRKFPIVGSKMEFTGNFVCKLCEERELKTQINNRGYRSVVFNKTTHMVHRLVAEGYCHKPEGCDYVNHIDGDKLNNHFSNLEWCTIAANNKHARDTGLNVKIPGYKVSYKSQETKSKALANLKDKSALTDDEVRYCRRVHIPRDPSYSATALAHEFNVSVTAMGKIVKGITYAHVK